LLYQAARLCYIKLHGFAISSCTTLLYLAVRLCYIYPHDFAISSCTTLLYLAVQLPNTRVAQCGVWSKAQVCKLSCILLNPKHAVHELLKVHRVLGRTFGSENSAQNAEKSLAWQPDVLILCAQVNYNVLCMLYIFKTIKACFGRVCPRKPASSSIFVIAHQTAQTV
jgi:hypothetical protein